MRSSIEIRDDAVWIVLDDGKVNAMSLQMLQEIDAHLGVAQGTAKPLVIKGRKGIFSAGFDLGTFAQGPEASRAMVRAGVALIERLLAFQRPVVTACTGHAYPMGAFLMLCADVRFGVAGDWSIGMNEVAIGLTVPHFAIELARHRLTPPGFARISTGPMFKPEEAVRLGYLDYVVQPEHLDDAVSTEVRRLQKLDMKSYERTKARLNGAVLAAIADARKQL